MGWKVETLREGWRRNDHFRSVAATEEPTRLAGLIGLLFDCFAVVLADEGHVFRADAQPLRPEFGIRAFGGRKLREGSVFDGVGGRQKQRRLDAWGRRRPSSVRRRGSRQNRHRSRRLIR